MKRVIKICSLLITILFFSFSNVTAQEIIVDNSTASTSYTGTWSISSNPNPYGTNSLWGRSGATYTWHADLPLTGNYEVYMWWTSGSSRSTSAPIDITHANGTKRVNVNERTNGGKWNLLGTFSFNTESGGTVKVSAPDPAPVSYCADAVKFVYLPPERVVIIDNGTPGTSSTGTWSVSSNPNPYGLNSLWSRSGATYTWHADLPQTASYEVYMWWTSGSSRSSNVPIDIYHADGTQRIIADQKTNGGKWNLLGTFTFNADTGGTIIITAIDPAPVSFCADAVRFVRVDPVNVPPVATIESIEPNPAVINTSVIFQGNYSDADGTVTAFSWNSSIDGEISTEASFISNSLSLGTHTISFKVQDNAGAWSPEVETSLIIETNNIPPVAAIESIEPNPALLNGTVTFQGNFSDDDGTVTAFSWRSNIDGEISTEAAFTSNTLSLGTHTISFRVQDNEGAWSPEAATTLLIKADNTAPVAEIESIVPSPALIGKEVTFKGSYSDIDGTVTGFSWRSSINGEISNEATFTKSDLSLGTHTITFKVQDDKGVWSPEVSFSLRITNTEHIYMALGYRESDTKSSIIDMLKSKGAVLVGSNYRIVRGEIAYIVHLVEDAVTLKQALMTSGAHIIYVGHASYGLGALFATPEERWAQKVDVRYIDDDRIFNYSSKWMQIDLHGIRIHQAYPNFWHSFKDGTSGLMPYRFGDANGNPPYNYFPTYKVPGDPTYYKIETARGGAIDRFYLSNIPAWYSPTGQTPDPANPNHLKYFITNNSPWASSIDVIGSWSTGTSRSGFYNENYRICSPGDGSKKINYKFTIPIAGNYKIYGWWPAHSLNTTQAPYTINHSDGATTVKVNQRINGNRWNPLGTFHFVPGDYSVVLTNAISSDSVIADAVRVSHEDNLPEVLQSDFVALPMTGWAPLTVRFVNQSTGEFTSRQWSFGDGLGNSTRDDLLHTYSQPGLYTVSLTVKNSIGTSTRVKEQYIQVNQYPPITKAEFAVYPVKSGTVPLDISFWDLSSGNIVSWEWDFGDGTMSTLPDPKHTYSQVGNYTVTLTVRDKDNNERTEIKENCVRAAVFEKNIDNIDYPPAHYSNKTILFRNDPEINEEELKYSRMAYIACNSGNYFIDTFHRGIMFYSVGTSSDWDGLHYLEAYLDGKSDYEIWQIIQSNQPVYDYYDFNKKPSEQD